MLDQFIFYNIFKVLSNFIFKFYFKNLNHLPAKDGLFYLAF